MKGKLISESLFEFERGRDPKKSIGIGMGEFLKKIQREMKKEYTYSEPPAKFTDKKILDYLIEKNRWDDIEEIVAFPGKLFSKKAFNSSIATLMDYPNKMGQESIIEKIDFLIEHGANPGIRNWGPFKRACSRGLPLVVEKFIDLGADVNEDTDIPIRNAVQGLENDHSWSRGNRQGYWDTIHVLAKHSKY